MPELLKRKSGQAIVLIALVLTVLIAGVGLAVDGGIGYFQNSSAERAAAAAALSGVIFMPDSFSPSQASPAGSGNDATDRAVAEAKRNGFDTADTADNVQVIPAAVAGASNKLQVTVSRTVRTFFMGMFGVSSYTVQHVAIATYLPPITLGQPGSQIGSTASQLGTGNNYYFMREEGWSTDRQQGDAYTPNPAGGFGGTQPSQDVHVISSQNGVDNVDASLPSRGGYNYKIVLPQPGYIQVYNAVFGPDGANSKPHNNCENNRQGSPTSAIGPCSSGGSYYLHEEDSVCTGGPPCSLATKDLFNAMEYSLFKVNSYFVRSSDQELSQVKVLPVDATNWSNSAATGKQYTNVNTGATINQTYNANGSPSNMLIYHNWIDINSYSGDSALMKWSSGLGPMANQPLPAGTYRLRVDSLNYDGTNPPGNGQAHKGYAVRVLDASRNSCASCDLGAWDDMCLYTPISTSAGGSFTIPIFQIPPDYAGKTITVDIYDPGDISGGGNVDIYILDNTGSPATPTPPQTVTTTDLGVTRTASGGTLIGHPSNAYFRATNSGTQYYNGHWVRVEIPIPSTYAPGANPANWWWSFQYQTSNGVTAVDTVTFAVNLKGNPAHLLQS